MQSELFFKLFICIAAVSYENKYLPYLWDVDSFYCYDTADWVTGRASSCKQDDASQIPKGCFQRECWEPGVTWSNLWKTKKNKNIIIIISVLLLVLFFFAHQHKAAGVKTKQKQRLQRLLIRCSLCWGRRPHSPPAELWTGVETGKLFLWCLGWWLWCVCQSPGLVQ